MPSFDREHNVVLVADDNQFIRFLIKKWLGHDAQIVEAAHGQDVVGTYLRERPNILFLDIHMPGKNGKQVLADLMKLDPEAFVIMLSADSNKDNVIEAVRKGAKAFVTKPFTRDTLMRYYHMCPSIKRADAAENQGENAGAADVAVIDVPA